MADEAVTPASSSDPEPVNQPPEIPEVEGAVGSADSRPDIRFGQHLTWVPKEFNNATIVGYDQNRHMVRAVRRRGDDVEVINIPEEKYKTLIETQKASELAHGIKEKKNLSKAISGYYGRSVSIEGKEARVLSYDGSSDEVLISDEKGKRWIKSGEMLRGIQTIGTMPTKKEAEVSRDREFNQAAAMVMKELKDLDPNLRVEVDKTSYVNADGSVKRGAHALRIFHKDDPNISWGMTWSDKSYVGGRLLKDVRKVYEEVRSGAPVEKPADTTKERVRQYQDVKERSEEILKNLDPEIKVDIQRVALNYLDGSKGENVMVLAFRHPTQPELSWNLQLKPGEVLSDAKLESLIVRSRQEQFPTSIRETRQELAQSRTATTPGVSGTLESTIEAAIPSAAVAATQASIVATANFAVAGLSNRIGQNQASSVQIRGQMGQLGERISQADQRIRQAPTPQAAATIEQEAQGLQEQRRALQNQLTTITVQMSNDQKSSDAIRSSLDQVASYPPEKAPAQVINDLRSVTPPIASLPTATVRGGTEIVAGAAAAINVPRARPALSQGAQQFFDQNRPPTSGQPGGSVPIQAIKPPLRALPDSTSEVRRAAQLNAGQNRSRRRSERPTELGLSDSLEEAMATEGALPGYSGVLDIPEGHAQSYAAGADNEPDEADIYGKAEEQGRLRQASLNRRGAGLSLAASPDDGFETAEPGNEGNQSVYLPQSEEEGAPETSDAEQAARLSAFASAIAQSQAQDQEQAATAEVGQKESLAEKSLKGRQMASRLIDLVDAAHGFEDFFGILMVLANENIRLLMTYFRRKSFFFPWLSVPLECGVVVWFDIFIFLVAFAVGGLIVIIIAALYAGSHPGEVGLDAIREALSGLF